MGPMLELGSDDIGRLGGPVALLDQIIHHRACVINAEGMIDRNLHRAQPAGQPVLLDVDPDPDAELPVPALDAFLDLPRHAGP